MSDSEQSSEIEFYSFVLVNEDEHSEHSERAFSSITKTGKRDETEVSESSPPVLSKDAFFSTLSSAFYSNTRKKTSKKINGDETENNMISNKQQSSASLPHYQPQPNQANSFTTKLLKQVNPNGLAFSNQIGTMSNNISQELVKRKETDSICVTSNKIPSELSTHNNSQQPDTLTIQNPPTQTTIGNGGQRSSLIRRVSTDPKFNPLRQQMRPSKLLEQQQQNINENDLLEIGKSQEPKHTHSEQTKVAQSNIIKRQILFKQKENDSSQSTPYQNNFLIEQTNKMPTPFMKPSPLLKRFSQFGKINPVQQALFQKDLNDQKKESISDSKNLKNSITSPSQIQQSLILHPRNKESDNTYSQARLPTERGDSVNNNETLPGSKLKNTESPFMRTSTHFGSSQNSTSNNLSKVSPSVIENQKRYSVNTKEQLADYFSTPMLKKQQQNGNHIPFMAATATAPYAIVNSNILQESNLNQKKQRLLFTNEIVRSNINSNNNDDQGKVLNKKTIKRIKIIPPSPSDSQSNQQSSLKKKQIEKQTANNEDTPITPQILSFKDIPETPRQANIFGLNFKLDSLLNIQRNTNQSGLVRMPSQSQQEPLKSSQIGSQFFQEQVQSQGIKPKQIQPVPSMSSSSLFYPKNSSSIINASGSNAHRNFRNFTENQYFSNYNPKTITATQQSTSSLKKQAPSSTNQLNSAAFNFKSSKNLFNGNAQEN